MVSHMTKYGKVEDADTVVLVTGLLQQFLVRYGYSNTHMRPHTQNVRGDKCFEASCVRNNRNYHHMSRP